MVKMHFFEFYLCPKTTLLFSLLYALDKWWLIIST